MHLLPFFSCIKHQFSRCGCANSCLCCWRFGCDGRRESWTEKWPGAQWILDGGIRVSRGFENNDFTPKQRQWLGSNSFTQRNVNYFHLEYYYYHGWMLKLSNLARVRRRRIPCESFDQWTINNRENLQKSRYWSSENKTTLQRKIMWWNRKKMIMTKKNKVQLFPNNFPANDHHQANQAPIWCYQRNLDLIVCARILAIRKALDKLFT